MKIRIKSMKQISFLISPLMTIKLNGIESAWLAIGDEVALDAPEGENVVHFSVGSKKTETRFRSINDVFIQTKRSAILGNIEALVTGDDVEVLKSQRLQ